MSLDYETRLEAFDAGWQAALAYMTPGTDLSTERWRIDKRILDMREARERERTKVSALDEAQAQGIDAYNEARIRHGLVPYDPRGIEASWAAFVEAAEA